MSKKSTNFAPDLGKDLRFCRLNAPNFDRELIGT